jgi:uncharacterized damage-inducible protein DinB
LEGNKNMKDHLISLYEYGDWVNQRLLDAAAELTAAQFNQEILPGFGSVHLTVAHMVGAEVLWFARWRGFSPQTMLSPDDLTTVPIIRERWAEVVEERRAYFAALNEAELSFKVSWTNMRGQAFELLRWQLILHCANHATHHRSEVAAILTELGHEPESSDLLEFYLERAGQFWKPTGHSS